MYAEAEGGAVDPQRRQDDPVVITTRDIYTLAAETAGKVDSVLAMVTSAQRTDDDHETRIRRLEARFMGIVATFGFAATAAIAWIGAAIMDRTS